MKVCIQQKGKMTVIYTIYELNKTSNLFTNKTKNSERTIYNSLGLLLLENMTKLEEG